MIWHIDTTFYWEGCILDDGRARLYSAIVNKGACARFAFAAAIFGDFHEALFWLQLPQALRHFMDKSTSRSREKISQSSLHPDSEQGSTFNQITSRERSTSGKFTKNAAVIVESDALYFSTALVHGFNSV